MEKQRLYKVVITKDEETGYYVAEVPTLAPCITFGDSIEEAIEMVKEAIEAVIESREDNGYPIFDDSEELERKHTTIETVLPFFQTPKKLQLVTA